MLREAKDKEGEEAEVLGKQQSRGGGRGGGHGGAVHVGELVDFVVEGVAGVLKLGGQSALNSWENGSVKKG